MQNKKIVILLLISFLAVFVIAAASSDYSNVKACFEKIETNFSDTIGEMSTDDPYLIYESTRDLVLNCLEGK